jgi:hypothetical protein
MIFVSSLDQERGESQLGQSASRHEGEEEWVIMGFDVRHGFSHGE